jgi:hypothetical protein
MGISADRPKPAKGRVRAGGRRQWLVYVDPNVIKETKKAAVDLDTTASGIVEEALKELLNRKAQSKASMR